MPLSRVLKGRGSVTSLTVSGEALFTPNGDLATWKRNFSRNATRATAQLAPENKRPRWAHYGKPLKSTFTTETRVNAASMMIHSTVGSSAPHALFPDQGTGVFAGGSPYEAKILPPWTRGSPPLYEETWRPNNVRVSRWGIKSGGTTVMIQGQRGQFFFENGLSHAFIKARMASIQIPGTGGNAISSALSAAPDMLPGNSGTTPAPVAFQAQLNQWREWKDRAWRAGRALDRSGDGGRVGATRLRAGKLDPRGRNQREAARRARTAANAQARIAERNAREQRRIAVREQAKAKTKVRTQQQVEADRRKKSIQAERTRFVNKATSKYSASRGYDVRNIRFEGGRWRVDIYLKGKFVRTGTSGVQF